MERSSRRKNYWSTAFPRQLLLSVLCCPFSVAVPYLEPASVFVARREHAALFGFRNRRKASD
jgi:hypothetical protein